MAASRSSDPVAKLVEERLPNRSKKPGDGPDPAQFDPAALPVTLPDRAEFF